MELYPLQVFLTVATEKSFSRAAEKLLRTQPAVSLALQRLEQELGEKLIDRSGKELMLTDAGRTVLDYARRFESLRQELENSLAELRDNSAGRLIIGANESTTCICCATSSNTGELIPKVKVQVRRSLSSKIPDELMDGNLELGVISYDPGRRAAEIEGDLHRSRWRSWFRRSTAWRTARPSRSPNWARRISSRTTCFRRTARWCCANFRRTRCRCTWTWRCRRWRPSAGWCRTTPGVAFLPRMCVEQEIEQGMLCEVRVKEIHVERKIRLVYPARARSATPRRAFLELLG